MSSSTGPASLTDDEEAACTAAASLYLLLEPMAAGRTVIQLSHGGAAGADRLRAVGAKVSVAPVVDGRIAAEDHAADLVLCLEAAFVGEGEVRHFLGELRRVTRPRGFALVRVEVAALLRRGVAGRTLARAWLDRLLRQQFAAVLIVEETPFVGVSFAVPGVEDVAVNEALAEAGGAPSHFLAFCAPGSEPPWHLPESLLVPLGFDVPAVPSGKSVAHELVELRAERDRLRSETAALTAERDGLREAVMTLQDRRDRHDETLSALRREAERQLRRNTETAAALEVTELERDGFERRAAIAEDALAEARAQLLARASEAASLRDEVARLRAARRDLARIRPATR